MVIYILLAIVFVNIFGVLYLGGKISILSNNNNGIKDELMLLRSEISSVRVLEVTNEEERKRAVLLSEALNGQIGTMKVCHKEDIDSLSLKYDRELYRLSKVIEYKNNEVQHLKSIIDVVKDKLKEQSKDYISSVDYGDEPETTPDYYVEASDEGAESYRERDGLSFQDEALLVYEGGVWGDDEYSEMGHDGDDY